MLNDGILAANAGADAARPEAAEVATLLPPVETVDALPPESLPGLIAGLAALQARAAARGLSCFPFSSAGTGSRCSRPPPTRYRIHSEPPRR